MKRNKTINPIGKQLIWSSAQYAIYKNPQNSLHEFYIDGDIDQAFPTFDKAYKYSMQVRGLKVTA